MQNKEISVKLNELSVLKRPIESSIDASESFHQYAEKMWQDFEQGLEVEGYTPELDKKLQEQGQLLTNYWLTILSQYSREILKNPDAYYPTQPVSIGDKSFYIRFDHFDSPTLLIQSATETQEVSFKRDEGGFFSDVVNVNIISGVEPKSSKQKISDPLYDITMSEGSIIKMKRSKTTLLGYPHVTKSEEMDFSDVLSHSFVDRLRKAT